MKDLRKTKAYREYADFNTDNHKNAAQKLKRQDYLKLLHEVRQNQIKMQQIWQQR